MRSIRILVLVLIPVLTVTFAGSAVAGPLGQDGLPVSVAASAPYGLADPINLAFWTLSRMAAATPLGERTSQAVPAAVGATASRPTAQTWTGSPTVGTLFLNNGSGSHYCSASVVNTEKKSLILTAAHCLYSSGGWAQNVVFVPRYSQGHRPYGTWGIRYLYVDSRWKNNRDPDLDFGFAVVGTINSQGVGDVVGGNRLVTDQGYTNRVRVIGYPMKKYASVDKPIYCNVTTRKAYKYQIMFDCNGFYGGTSGSPWLENYNTTTRRGDVLGVIGGYQEGGKYSWRSYSPVFDKDIRHLYASASERG